MNRSGPSNLQMCRGHSEEFSPVTPTPSLAYEDFEYPGYSFAEVPSPEVPSPGPVTDLICELLLDEKTTVDAYVESLLSTGPTAWPTQEMGSYPLGGQLLTGCGAQVPGVYSAPQNIVLPETMGTNPPAAQISVPETDGVHKPPGKKRGRPRKSEAPAKSKKPASTRKAPGKPRKPKVSSNIADALFGTNLAAPQQSAPPPGNADVTIWSLAAMGQEGITPQIPVPPKTGGGRPRKPGKRGKSQKNAVTACDLCFNPVHSGILFACANSGPGHCTKRACGTCTELYSWDGASSNGTTWMCSACQSLFRFADPVLPVNHPVQY